MKVLSLFDGVSCARLAIEKNRIPIEAYYASEIDKYAIKVAQANRPDTIQLGSVTGLKITGDEFCVADNYMVFSIPLKTDIDLLIGGSPCQDLSIAKKDRKGLDGERSSLFWEYVRILNEVKPKYFILENVASMPQKDKDIISQTLGVQPVMINASLVSAQNRKRLFWVGKRTDNDNYEQVYVPQPEDKGILLKDILEDNDDDSYQIKNVNLIGTQSNIKKELNFIGGIRNKDWAKDGKNYSRNFGQGDRVYSPEGKSATLSALGGGRGAKTGLYLVGNVNPSGKGMNGAVHNVIGKSPTINTNKGEGQKIYNEGTIRKLTPVECERLQCMPDNWTNPTGDISNSQRYKMCGNAFNVDVVAHIIKFLK